MIRTPCSGKDNARGVRPLETTELPPAVIEVTFTIGLPSPPAIAP